MKITKDHQLEERLSKLERKMKYVDSIPQIPADTTLERLIEIVNIITNNQKRRR